MQREIQAPTDMTDYYVYRYYTEDKELGEAIFELRRALQSPWREDLLPLFMQSWKSSATTEVR